MGQLEHSNFIVDIDESLTIAELFCAIVDELGNQEGIEPLKEPFNPKSFSKILSLSLLLKKLKSSIGGNEKLSALIHLAIKQCDKSLSDLVISAAPAVLARDMSYFRPLKGVDIFQRLEPFNNWKSVISKERLWFFEKSSISAPTSYCSGIDHSNCPIKGVNFASQDYLSLSSHPAIKEAAIKAIQEYGVHSAGSPAGFGNTKFSMHLEGVISRFVSMESVTLYPTGWGAGFGVLSGLIRPKDYVLMDQLSHACLREGAIAATQNVSFFPHLDNGAVEQKLKAIRVEDKEHAILVVTETLFSMDSDSPNLEELQAICHRYGAFLLVDIAHDLGCLGETGKGILEDQRMIGKVDLLIGSFSKTFASNGGFIAANSKAVKEYLSFFSGPRIFSNALSPVQTAAVIQAFEIIGNKEGQYLSNCS